jgi:hypothetical protein
MIKVLLITEGAAAPTIQCKPQRRLLEIADTLNTIGEEGRLIFSVPTNERW